MDVKPQSLILEGDWRYILHNLLSECVDFRRAEHVEEAITVTPSVCGASATNNDLQ